MFLYSNDTLTMGAATNKTTHEALTHKVQIPIPLTGRGCGLHPFLWNYSIITGHSKCSPNTLQNERFARIYKINGQMDSAGHYTHIYKGAKAPTCN